MSGGADWGVVAAVAGVAAVVETPMLLLASAAWRWARSVDLRLDRIEARSHERRVDD